MGYIIVPRWFSGVLKNNQKAPSKGGHHLGLFDPTTHLFDTGRFPGA